MATEAARILHISDLHLIHPGRVQRWLSYLSHLPLDPGQVWQREDYDIFGCAPGRDRRSQSRCGLDDRAQRRHRHLSSRRTQRDR